MGHPLDSHRIWKTIKLGGFKKADDLLQAMKENRETIETCAYKIICHPDFAITDEEIEVDLVAPTLEELGIRRNPSIYGGKGPFLVGIKEVAFEYGYELCPAEVGPQLRLQYSNQPKGEEIIVMMDTTKFHVEADDIIYNHVGFSVENKGGGTILRGQCQADHMFCSPGCGNVRFAFVCPRK